MSPLCVRACFVGASLLLTVGASPAGAAPNLIANGGFETAGSSQTVFSDTLPDLAAWSVVAGGFTVAAATMVPAGAPASRDEAVVTNSFDYTDGTFEIRVTPQNTNPNLTAGAVFRHQSAGNAYACGLTKGQLLLTRRTGGVETTLGTASFTSVDGTAYRLRATALGIALTCSVQAVAGGATATVTRSDGAYSSGSIGVFNANPQNGQTRRAVFSQPVMTAVGPSGWSGLALTAGRPGLVPDVIAPNTGSSHLQLFSGSGAFEGQSQQTVAAAGSTLYTLQAALRATSVTGSAQVLAIESPSGTTTTLASASGTTAWTVYAASFTTQPSTTQVTVRLRLAGSGRAGFDDISLSESPYVFLALSAAVVDFGGVDPISSPRVLTHAMDATMRSNSSWRLSVAGTGSFSDGAGKTFPLGQMEWRLTGSGSAFTPFTTAAAAIAAGGATPATGTATPLDLRLSVSYADPVSALPFQTSLTYIATTP